MLLDTTCPEKFTFCTGIELAKVVQVSKGAKCQVSAFAAQKFRSRNAKIPCRENVFEDLYRHQKLNSFLKEAECLNPSVLFESSPELEGWIIQLVTDDPNKTV